MKVYDTPPASNSDFIDSPAYRVHFWSPSGEVWSLESYIVIGAKDVREVLDWAYEQSPEHPIEIFVEMDNDESIIPGRARSTGLLRIFGDDPTDGVSIRLAEFVEADDDFE